MWTRQTESPGSNIETPGRSPPKQKKKETEISKMFLKNKNSRLPQRHFGSYLYVKRTSQLVAALSLHGLNLCVMESVES